MSFGHLRFAELTNVVAIAGGDWYGLALIGDGPPANYALVANPSWTTNGFSLSFLTRYGKIYSVEYKNSLLGTNWSLLPLIPGNGEMRIFTDSSAPTGQRFYRVRQW